MQRLAGVAHGFAGAFRSHADDKARAPRPRPLGEHGSRPVGKLDDLVVSDRLLEATLNVLLGAGDAVHTPLARQAHPAGPSESAKPCTPVQFRAWPPNQSNT